jgi:uncharacterized protein (TIGR02001 family)
MNLKKLNFAVITVLTSASVVTAEEAAPLTANIGVVSNYIWRGLTQSKDGPAVQGGIDYVDPSGFSLGTWASNVDAGTDKPTYEVDIYGAYEAKLGDFSYKLTTGYYLYPDGKDINMWDLTPSISWKFFTIGLTYTLDGEPKEPSAFRQGDFYYYGGLTFDLPVDFKLNGTIGHYNFNDLGKEGDYTNWQVSVSKSAGDFGTFSLNYDQTDGGEGDIVATEDDPKLWVSWKKTF